MLVYIYNLSIQKNKFNKHFKVALVKPLLKDKDCKNMNNYRSIFKLINFSEI